MGHEHARRRDRAQERPAPRPAGPSATSAHDAVIGLQRAAGNRAVAGSFVRVGSAAPRAVQRVHVDGAFDENLLQPYDARNRPTRALTPHVYSQDVHYDLTRGAAQVDVVVKIRFVAPDNSQIPAADTARRTYIANMCAGVEAAWGGKYVFVTKAHPPPPATGTGTAPAPTPAPAPGTTAPPAPGTAAPPAAVDVRLPVKFTATPEYSPADDGTMPVVHVHPQTEAADSSRVGKRIDSGNWFMNMGDYDTGDPNEAVKTAAHEYGHLLGIPDEYSQSNAQMHKLMHQASPTIAAGEDQKLDDAATKYMVLRAMGPSLGRHARVASQRATKAIGAKRAHLEQEVRAAISGLWSDAGVINAVKAQVAPQLITGGHPALVARIEALLRHQGAGVDTGKIARTVVTQQIGASSIQTLVFGALRTALLSAQRVTIPITNASGQASTMNVEIGTSQTVNKAASAGALNQAAEKVAGATLDAPAGKGGKAPPSLRPSGSFVSELQALTSTWTAGADTLATQAAAIKGKAGDEYRTWALDATSTADETQLARFLGGVVEALSVSLGGEAINTFLSSTFATMMQGQIDAITAAVQTEIDAHRTATPTGTSAAPVAAPDPRVAAAVAKVSAKMRALQAAPGTAVPGAKMAGATAAPTTQHSSFTVLSMMGSGNEGGMRIDYLAKILESFNAQFKKPDEDAFKTETGS
ncbi:MAG: hypothetical protein JNM77_03575 [Pseudonocardia sp.]|nr:hypothetical protein [Pseudonocardia sp.]